MGKGYRGFVAAPFLLTLILTLSLLSPGLLRAKNLPAAKPVSTSEENADSSDEGAEENANSSSDLSQMSLEKLADLDVQVVSSAKKSESLRDATSAIYVITAEDIRRSSARTLPDLLAMVPGVQVARQSANEWAISARGFNSQYNNKMLVLVDGRNVFDPTFGKVNWNELDLFLPDIDRIEVIRGPGGTLWGCNAVNGIVNIITKDSKNTQGLYLSSLAGYNFYPGGQDPRVLDSRLQVRYGGTLSPNVNFRAYGQFSSEEPFVNPVADSYETDLGTLWNDGWYDFRAGGRLDWHNDTDQVTVETELQKGHFDYARLTTAVDPVFDPDTFVSGNDLNTEVDQNAHFSLRWSRDFADGSQIQAQGTYDYHNITNTNDDRIENFGQAEAQFQHRFPLGSWNEVTYGGNFRNYADQFLNPLNFYFDPQNEVLNIYGGYVQDRLTLVDGKLFLTGGVKLENNSFTGAEWQPSGRVLFTPDENNSFWGAVSKVDKIPPQVGTNLTIYFGGAPAGVLGPTAVYGGFLPNPALGVETLVSYELGYRTNLTPTLSIDLATFYNHYDGIVRFMPLTGTFYSPAGGVISDPLPIVQPQNGGAGDIYGAELAGEWKPVKSLKLSLSYALQDYDQNMIDASNIESGAPPPHNLANFRAYFDPFSDWEVNSGFYFTDTTYMYDPIDQTHIVPAYCRWDLSLVYKPEEGSRLEIGATDLEGGHQETLPAAFVDPAQVVPSIYTKITLEY